MLAGAFAESKSSISLFVCGREVMAKHAVNGFRNELCGRVNRSGPIPRDMRSSAGSSIVLEGCSFQGDADHAFGAEVYLVEIPAQLVIRDSWMQAEVSRPFPSWNRSIE
jgi:hypothetical protein